MVSPRRVVLVVVLVALACFALAIPATAQTDATDDENVTTAESLSETDVSLSLEELRRGGPTIDGNPDSVRVDQRMWWLMHWPSDTVLADVGSMTDHSSEFVSRGDTVTRNAVYLRTNTIDPPTDPQTIKIVYWTEGTQTRETAEGSTIEEPVAREIVVDEHEVTLNRGMNIHEIPLRTSDEPRQVSMWLEDNNDIRWTFSHESVATTQTAGIDTRGDYLYLVATQFLIPIVFGAALTGSVARKAIKQTGIGPGYPVGFWVVGIAIATGVALLWWFSSIAQLLAWAPQILAGLVIAIVGVVVLESQAIGDRKVAFIQPTVKSIEGPDDEEGADSLIAAASVERVVDMPAGPPAVVRRGILSFLARWRGRAARVPNLAFETRIKTPVGPWSEIIMVDPEADTVLDYQAEGWDLEPPEIDNRDDMIKYGALALVVVAISVTVALELALMWGVGLLAVAVLVALARPVDGSASVEPASAHVRAAWISTITLSQKVDDARTLDQARETIVGLQSETQQEIQRVVEKQDATLVESALGMDLDRSVDGPSDDDIDDVDLETALAKIDQIDPPHAGEEEPADD